MSDAKKAAIAKLNAKLGDHGWYSEDFTAGFDLGWQAALVAARQVIAGEDSIEWARGAKSSGISIAYAIDGLDALD